MLTPRQLNCDNAKHQILKRFETLDLLTRLDFRIESERKSEKRESVTVWECGKRSPWKAFSWEEHSGGIYNSYEPSVIYDYSPQFGFKENLERKWHEIRTQPKIINCIGSVVVFSSPPFPKFQNAVPSLFFCFFFLQVIAVAKLSGH